MNKIAEENQPGGFGIMLFDAPAIARCKQIATTIMGYFYRTKKGQEWTNIIPNPFFVDSSITPGIQIADLFCYIISGNLSGRKELNGLFNLLKRELEFVSGDGNIRGLRGCKEKETREEEEEE